MKMETMKDNDRTTFLPTLFGQRRIRISSQARHKDCDVHASLVTKYHALKDYAASHAESGAIYGAID